MKNKNFRQIQINSSSFQENTIQLSFASPTPYQREDNGWIYEEILVISDDSVNYERLVDGKSPLLLNHDPDLQIGVVERAWRDGQKLKASVRFSQNKFPQEILADVKNGIRRNISFGYMIDAYDIVKGSDIDKVYVKRFTPFEISICSIPADANVGVNRNMELNNMQKQIDEQIQKEDVVVQILPKEEIQEEVVDEKNEEVVNDEKEEVVQNKVQEEIIEKEDVSDKQILNESSEQEEIRACGELAQEEKLAEKCIEEKRSLAEFKQMLKNKRNLKSKQQEIKSMEKFSLSKAIRNACSQYKKDISEEYETKVIAENKRKLHVGEEADIVLTKRELANTATNGAELVKTDYLPQEFTPAARPVNTLAQTGYYSLPVEGNAVSFAVVTSGATAAMYDLDGELAASDMHFANRTLTPHKMGTVIPIPYSLILQARPEIDAIVQDDMVKALEELKDQQILTGTGLSGQVTGITNTDGINEITGAASAIYSWNGILSMEKAIRDANEFGYLNFVMNSTDYMTFASTLKDEVNSYDGWILEDGKIKDYRVFVNNALPTGTIILGDFSQVVVADFDGLMIKVDDITFIKKQAIQIVATEAFDVCIRRPKAFCKATVQE